MKRNLKEEHKKYINKSMKELMEDRNKKLEEIVDILRRKWLTKTQPGDEIK